MPRRRLFLTAAIAAGALLAGAAPAGAAEYDDDTVIVKLKRGAPGLERALGAPAARRKVLGRIDGVGAYVLRVNGDPAGVADKLGRRRFVDYAEPNFVLGTGATPNDPFFRDLYGLHNTGQTGGSADADIDAPEGWDQAGLATFPSAGGAKVGIIDTGIDRTHLDLAGRTADCATSVTAGTAIVSGVCDDDNGHGTHVAGTVAANADNGRGVAGVSFNSPLSVCKALATPLGTGFTSDVANCIAWTKSKGARVISMSLGGGESETLKRAVQNAWDGGNGALLVAAAGNDGDGTLNYPAAYAEVVSVAATDDRDARAEFSNANPDVEVAAPGVDILSTFPGSLLYAYLSGTSMATPHASGVAAVVFTENPGASAASVRNTLTSTADDLGPGGRDPSFGHGRVNLCRAAGGACAYTGGG